MDTTAKKREIWGKSGKEHRLGGKNFSLHCLTA